MGESTLNGSTYRIGRVLIIAALATALVAGCQPQEQIGAPGDPLLTAPGGTPAPQLAARLGLRITRSLACQVAMRGDGVSVLLFADPDGQAFVNGTAVGPTGGFARADDTIIVPPQAADAVSRAVRQAAATATVVVTHGETLPLPLNTASLGRVVIDPGHGGRDPGAPCAAGAMSEKDVNLAVAIQLARLLRESRVDVTMTRSDDRFVELEERAAIANRAGADLFVSLHADACDNPLITGFSVYVARKPSQASLTLANRMQAALAATDTINRGVKHADFRVLVKTDCPAVLIEMGYVSNRAESLRLGDSGHQSALARAICQGVLDSLR